MATKTKNFVVRVEKDLCKACYLCIKFCPKDCLALSQTGLNQEGMAYVECIQYEECTGCLACSIICPDGAIEVFESE